MGFAGSMIRMSFLEWLNKEENDLRLQNYATYDSYYQGYHEDTLPSEIREAFDNPLSVVCNYCRSVVDIATRYICGNPTQISLDVTSGGGSNELTEWGERYLYQIYRESGMFDTKIIKMVRTMCKKGDVFVKLHMIGEGDYETMRIESLRPEVCYPRYADDDYEAMSYCAVKWFNLVDSGERQWYAQVFYPPTLDEEGVEIPAVVHTYNLGSVAEGMDKKYAEDEDGVLSRVFRTPVHTDPKGVQPELIGIDESPFPFIPIWHVKNNIDDLKFGVSDIMPVVSLQNLLNKLLTDLSQVMDFQAFQRMFVFGATSDERYFLAPGVITNVPSDSGRLDVVPPVNIGNFLFALDKIEEMISMVSSTPRPAFAEWARGVPASGFALTVQNLPLDDKCNEKKVQLKRMFRELNRAIFWKAGEMGLADGITKNAKDELASLSVEVHFPGGLPRDELLEAQKYMMYQQMGVMDNETIMEKLGLENIPEIQLRLQKQNEAIAAMMKEEEAEAS